MKILRFKLLLTVLGILLFVSFVSADWVRVSNVTTGAITNNIYICNSTESCGFNWTDILNKPTTILGYGITDAYNMTSIDSLLSSYVLTSVFTASQTAQNNTINTLSGRVDAINSSLSSYVLITDYNAGQLVQNTTINSKIDSAYGNATYYLLSNPLNFINATYGNATYLLITDQRYNDSARIDALNGSFMTQTYGNATYYLLSNPKNYLNQTSADLLYYSISNPSSFLTLVTAQSLNESALIDTERSQRISNDSSLQTQITNLGTGNITALNLRVDSLNSTIINNNASLQSEITNRQNADNNLQTNISSLMSANVSTNSRIDSINTTVSTHTSQISGIQTNITSVNTTATTALSLATTANTTANNAHTNSSLMMSYNSTIARIGSCANGYYAQNTTISGVQCVALGTVNVSGTDTLDGQHGDFYRNVSNVNAGLLLDTYISSASTWNAKLSTTDYTNINNSISGRVLNATLNDYATLVYSNSTYARLTSSNTFTGNNVFTPTTNTTFNNDALFYGAVYFWNNVTLSNTNAMRVNSSIILTDIAGNIRFNVSDQAGVGVMLLNGNNIQTDISSRVINATLNSYVLNSVLQSNYSELSTLISGRTLNATTTALSGRVDTLNSTIVTHTSQISGIQTNITSVNTTATTALSLATTANTTANNAHDDSLLVDARVTSVNTTAVNALPKSGGTMTGNITMSTDLRFIGSKWKWYLNATYWDCYNGSGTIQNRGNTTLTC